MSNELLRQLLKEDVNLFDLQFSKLSPDEQAKLMVEDRAISERFRAGKLAPFVPDKKIEGLWWTSRIGQLGEVLFSFDRVKVYNYWEDYPNNLTKAQRELVDKSAHPLAK